MPQASATPLNTARAIERANRILEAARRLNDAADAVSSSRGSDERAAAEALKDSRLLSHRVNTIPSNLVPVLEALIAAASSSAAPEGALV